MQQRTLVGARKFLEAWELLRIVDALEQEDLCLHHQQVVEDTAQSLEVIHGWGQIWVLVETR